MAFGLKRRWIDIPKFAHEVGCDDELVYCAIREGNISVAKAPSGKMMIDALSQKVRFLEQHPQIVKRILENKQLAKDKEDRKKLGITDEMDAAFDDSTLGVMNASTGIQNSKARKEKALARKAELDAEEREGNLVDLKGLVRVWKTVAIETRKAVLSIPDRVAPIMAGERDQHKCHRLLTEELNHCLRTLSQNMRDLLLREEELSKIEEEYNTTEVADGNK